MLCSVGSLLTISSGWPDPHAEHVRGVAAALLIERDRLGRRVEVVVAEAVLDVDEHVLERRRCSTT